MADKTLLDMVSENPVTVPLNGAELIETVLSSVGSGAVLRQLSFVPIGTQSGTGYTLVLEDQGRLVHMTNSSANIITVPPDAVLLPIGATVLVEQNGTGKTTFLAGAGVTINVKSSASLSISERYGRAVLHKVAANLWHLTGELELA